MKTQIKKNEDSIVVIMDGHIDFETYVPLREDLSRLISETKTELTPKKIIFDLEKLEFVGSSGISSFIQTLKEFNANSPTKPTYCNVKSEFRRIIKAFDEEELFDFYEPLGTTRKLLDQ